MSRLGSSKDCELIEGTKILYDNEIIKSLYFSTKNFTPIINQYNKLLKNRKSDKFINNVIELNTKIFDMKRISYNNFSNISYKIQHLSFSNLLCYGDCNYINFDNYDKKVLNIMSDGAFGKSKIANIINFAIYGLYDNGNFTLDDLINKHFRFETAFTCIYLKTSDQEYRINRTINPVYEKSFTNSNILVKTKIGYEMETKLFIKSNESTNKFDKYILINDTSNESQIKDKINELFGNERYLDKFNLMDANNNYGLIKITNPKDKYDHFIEIFNLQIFQQLRKNLKRFIKKHNDINNEILTFYKKMISMNGIPKLLLNDILQKLDVNINEALLEFEEPFKINIKLEKTEKIPNICFYNDTNYDVLRGDGNYNNFVIDFVTRISIQKLLRSDGINFMFLDNYLIGFDENNEQKLVKYLKYITDNVGVCMIIDNLNKIVEDKNLKIRNENIYKDHNYDDIVVSRVHFSLPDYLI